MKKILTFAAALLASAPLVTQAVPIMNAAEGLDDPDVLIDFSTLVGGIAVTDEFADLGLEFNGPFLSQAICVSPMVGPCLNSSNGAVTSIYGMEFNASVTEFALELITNPGMTTFTALLGGAIVETFTAMTDLGGGDEYYGFENILFDEVRFQISADSSNFNLDNLQYSLAPTAVPEPGTLGLLAIGLLGLGLARRRHA